MKTRGHRGGKVCLAGTFSQASHKELLVKTKEKKKITERYNNISQQHKYDYKSSIYAQKIIAWPCMTRARWIAGKWEEF